ncbi:DUF1848 domain-containing protein [Lachnotalea glycerini]|uniref:DUF1848 domain-containing protein n=1 Tax=Lachnotalea glycerini TaxID=1763509 RepID=A0A371JH14_9FIRM|nr:DUF1848 domain-containing protein [Lachnotalea glycerini]RDY32023.1 DUF1848 domain-containing protein [Lachnotalea glycerini]
MIISASRRTDIPCYFSDWFINRIEEGFVYTRNPMNYRSVSNITLKPEVVDFIVFWTKNPNNMLNKLKYLENYQYYFQFTLNGYGTILEKNIPPRDELISIFIKLSQLIGKEKVIWRYDPIILNKTFDINFHTKNFEFIAKSLKNHTGKVVISFFDMYKKISKKMRLLEIGATKEIDILELARILSDIAHRNNLIIETCAEKYDLSKYGINHGQCIDDKLIGGILGSKINVKKDKNQRLECGCVQSVDIGAYNTCPNCCQYCYANASDKTIEQNFKHYKITSSILCGDIEPEDIIKERVLTSFL